MGAIFRKELSTYFTSPIGYFYLAVFYAFSGFFFYIGSIAYSNTSIITVFSSLFTILVFIIPVLTMRLFSEEFKQKTDQLMLTSPVSLTSIVTGKFFASMLMFTIGIAIIPIYGLIISLFADAGWTEIIGNLIGFFLLGAVLISIGMFISSLTENQIIAAVGSFVAMIFLIMLDQLADAISVEFISNILNAISPYTKYEEITSALFTLSTPLYFISITVIFVFLTIKVLDKKRWS